MKATWKRILCLLLALTLALTLAGCSKKQEETPSENEEEVSSEASNTESRGTHAGTSTWLKLYTWNSMFPESVLEEFTEETGIRIDYTTFDYNETMVSRLEKEAFDLVIADEYILPEVIEKGLAQKLNAGELENGGNIDSRYQSWYFDPKNEYTIPYGAAVQTIVYDPDGAPKLTGWEDLWDSRLAGKLGMVRNPRLAVGIALKTRGESYNTEDPQIMVDSRSKLLELAPSIGLLQDNNLQDALLSGEISAAVMYTTQVSVAKRANAELKVILPEEGVCFGLQEMFIPASATHTDAAYRFLDFILRPEIAARCYEYLGLFSTNTPGSLKIREEYREFLTLPEDWPREKMELMQDVPEDAASACSLLWEEFAAACGG